MTEEPKLQFPCRFPIKVMGKLGTAFETEVLQIIHQYVPDLAEGAIKYQKSSNGNYLSITITIEAQNQQQLDSIYQALSSCKHVIMAL